MTEEGKSVFTYQDIPVTYYKVGQGPPLLLLHGWGSRASVMMPLAGALGDIRTCYIPDLPGFGDTPAPGRPWNVDDYADMVTAFASLAGTSAIDVLAHSFGGRITLKWAAREHADIAPKKVIITGGAGMKPRRTFSFYRRRALAMLLKLPFQLLPQGLKSKALSWLRETRIWKSLGSSDYRELDGVMRETFVRTVSEHLESCLPYIDQEVLLLWGKDDPYTPWYQAARMEKGLKNGALVGIDNAGHYAFLDQPGRFTRISKAFLEPDGS